MLLQSLFICEGTSDAPLEGLVTSLFNQHGLELRGVTPDFDRLETGVGRSLTKRLSAARTLLGDSVDVVVIHRDADGTNHEKRGLEMQAAMSRNFPDSLLVPVVPRRTMEAWLLLDEEAIRRVVGNPRGTAPLALPTPSRAEAVADPKRVLRTALLAAADVTGRRRRSVEKRFESHRRQLLERLDPLGPVSSLDSWQRLLADVGSAAATLTTITRSRPVHALPGGDPGRLGDGP